MEKKINNDEKDSPKLKGAVKKWDVENTVYIPNEVAVAYCNNARINFSTWDMSITFGEIMGEKEAKLQVLPRMKVTMSLQFAKAFSRLISENIKRFEEQINEIQEFQTNKLTEVKK